MEKENIKIENERKIVKKGFHVGIYESKNSSGKAYFYMQVELDGRNFKGRVFLDEIDIDYLSLKGIDTIKDYK